MNSAYRDQTKQKHQLQLGFQRGWSSHLPGGYNMSIVVNYVKS